MAKQPVAFVAGPAAAGRKPGLDLDKAAALRQPGEPVGDELLLRGRAGPANGKNDKFHEKAPHMARHGMVPAPGRATACRTRQLLTVTTSCGPSFAHIRSSP